MSILQDALTHLRELATFEALEFWDNSTHGDEKVSKNIAEQAAKLNPGTKVIIVKFINGGEAWLVEDEGVRIATLSEFTVILTKCEKVPINTKTLKRETPQ